VIRAIPIWILCEVLLVIVGAEAFSFTEITDLSCRGPSTGRLLVDVDGNPPVDELTLCCVYHVLSYASVSLDPPIRLQLPPEGPDRQLICHTDQC
jgi:hypothetical protein